MWSALDLYKFWVPSTHQDVDAVAIYKSDKGSITMTSHVLNNMTFETNFTIYTLLPNLSSHVYLYARKLIQIIICI